MPDLCVDIKKLNKEINQAFLNENFSRILYLDQKRRNLIKSLASNKDFKASEKNLNFLKKTAEDNHNMMKKITQKMNFLTTIRNKKIKMLRSYHQNI
tara:strand:+ start:306 stop:596 length:291 start_codon:yes stop_codon:yes gene_type:complete